MEEIKDEESGWDKKKIILALLVAVVIGFGVKAFVSDGRKENSPQSIQGVKTEITGVQVQSVVSPSPSFNLVKTLQQKVEAIRAEVQNLNIAEIASSSPQIQKALNDLKALEQYPRNEAKELCQTICSSF